MSKIRSWLQLVRVPNLLTVPGDPIAGFLLGSMAVETVDPKNLISAILISLLLYMAGLIMNDIYDVEEDKKERPNRPLPSWAISVTVAKLVMSILFLAALLIAWTGGCSIFWVAIGLSGLIVFYNTFAKRFVLIGSMTMGCCRGANLLLGAAAIGYTPVVISAALLLVLYIATVSLLARHETRGTFPKILPWLPMAVLLIGAITLVFFTFSLLFVVLLAVALFSTFAMGFFIKKHQQVTPGIIGRYIRSLLIIQAGLCLLPDLTNIHFICAIILLLFYPISFWLGKSFYSS